MDRLRTCIQMDFDTFLFHHFFDTLGNILIVAGHKPVAAFENSHFTAESGIHRSKFQSDIPAADNNQMFGQDIHIQERGTGVHMLALLNAVDCRNNRSRTGIDKDFFSLQFDVPVRERYLDSIGRYERSRTCINSHIRTLAQSLIIVSSKKRSQTVFTGNSLFVHICLFRKILVVE